MWCACESCRDKAGFRGLEGVRESLGVSGTMIILLITFISIDVSNAASSTISKCDEVRQAYQSMGFSPLDVPVSSIIEKRELLLTNTGCVRFCRRIGINNKSSGTREGSYLAHRHTCPHPPPPARPVRYGNVWPSFSNS